MVRQLSRGALVGACVCGLLLWGVVAHTFGGAASEALQTALSGLIGVPAAKMTAIIASATLPFFVGVGIFLAGRLSAEWAARQPAGGRVNPIHEMPPMGFDPRTVRRASAIPIVEQAGERFTDKTVAQLLSLFDGRTPLQASPLIEPFRGLWIRVSGVVLSTVDGGVDAVAVLQSEGRHVECRFPKTFAVALRRYDKGDTMKVAGVIAPHQNGQQLYLTSCKLDE